MVFFRPWEAVGGVVLGASCISLVNDNYLSFSLLRVKGDFNVGQQNKTTIAWVLQKKQ